MVWRPGHIYTARALLWTNKLPLIDNRKHFDTYQIMDSKKRSKCYFKVFCREWSVASCSSMLSLCINFHFKSEGFLYLKMRVLLVSTNLFCLHYINVICHLPESIWVFSSLLFCDINDTPLNCVIQMYFRKWDELKHCWCSRLSYYINMFYFWGYILFQLL